MACNDDYRHVCFKDLDNYFKKDTYFSDLSDEEKALVRKNLGIPEDNSDNLYNPTTIIGTYDYIKNLVDLSQLQLDYLYIINNFRSIYSIDNVVLGLDNVPSTEYYVILRPVSTNMFDSRVSLMAQSTNATASGTRWQVEYSIYPKQMADGTMDRGQITYLKDENNNSAYYDFKNIKFKRTLEELNKGANTYTEDQYVFTFDNAGADNSLTSNCKNNTLGKGAWNNVFFGLTQNNTLAADAHNNTFFKSCENNVFDYGTRNNYFINDVRQCKGTVHDKELAEVISMQCPKAFNILDDKQILVYLDSETQTFQFKNL